MPDWRHDIDELLKSQGFEKKAAELSADDQAVIQEFLDNIGKPAFENICDQLNSFQNIRAEVMPSKKAPQSVIESFELSVYKMTQPKLAYRLNFLKKENGINITGEYSTPNIYGENTRYQGSGLNKALSGTTEEDIASDFFTIMKSKF
jgi:hypothetical protein